MPDHLLASLGVTAACIAVLMGGTLAVGLRTRTHVVVDTVWGLGFVLVAAVSFALAPPGAGMGVRLVLVAMTGVWGLRLALHLLLRSRGAGEDPRYAALLRRRTGRAVPFLVRRVYGPQGAAMWVVSLPVQAGIHLRTTMGPVALAGLLVWAVGVGFESVGDRQLARFRADPTSAGRVLDTGLWGYTRHPNYFGDACVWWGLWLTSATLPAAAVTVVGPVLMTHLLVARSGKALLERRLLRSRGDAYADYVARTSGFLPRRPRPTCVPGLTSHSGDCSKTGDTLLPPGAPHQEAR